MKTKKQLLIIFILLTSILVNFGYASWSDNTLPVEELYDVVSCSNSSKLYLDEDNDSDSLSDMFFYLNSNFTLVGEKEQSYTAGQIMREMNGTIYTKVKYYTPLQNMFYKISNTNQTGDIDNYTFWRASRVFPYNTAVRGIATTPNKVVFEQPTDNDNEKNIISIVYNYKYKYAIDFDGNSTSAYWYNQIPDMSYVGNNYVTFYEILPGNYGNRKDLGHQYANLKLVEIMNLIDVVMEKQMNMIHHGQMNLNQNFVMMDQTMDNHDIVI